MAGLLAHITWRDVVCTSTRKRKWHECLHKPVDSLASLPAHFDESHSHPYRLALSLFCHSPNHELAPLNVQRARRFACRRPSSRQSHRKASSHAVSPGLCFPPSSHVPSWPAPPPTRPPNPSAVPPSSSDSLQPAPANTTLSSWVLPTATGR